MTNVIPFANTRTMSRIPALPDIDLDEDELSLRLWELAMSGQRNTHEYRRLESKVAGQNAYSRPSDRLF